MSRTGNKIQEIEDDISELKLSNKTLIDSGGHFNRRLDELSLELGALRADVTKVTNDILARLTKLEK